MTFDYSSAMAAADFDLPYAYDDRLTRLYGLSVGMAQDPLRRQELDFVYEKNLKALPTMATMIAWMARDVRKLGVDYARVLHGEQKLTIHRPLPVRARLLADTRTLGIHDKGRGVGALVVSQIDIRLADGGAPLCTLQTTHFARGDGGFAEGAIDSGPAPRPHAIPDRAPDARYQVGTRPDQAILFRLLGDDNPLHVDPDDARAAGFDGPILQGVCLYGICCRVIVAKICDYQPERIARFDVRFAGVLYPGETLDVSIWRDGPDVSFRAHCRERNVTIIDNGLCVLTC